MNFDDVDLVFISATSNSVFLTKSFQTIPENFFENFFYHQPRFKCQFPNFSKTVFSS